MIPSYNRPIDLQYRTNTRNVDLRSEIVSVIVFHSNVTISLFA